MNKWNVTQANEEGPEGLQKFRALTFQEALELTATLRAKGLDVRIRCEGQATQEEIEALKRLGSLEIY